TDEPLWWQGVDSAAEVSRLKTVPDVERRAAVAALAPRSQPQLSRDDVTELAHAADIGNHTWDHPLLDRCDDDEQRRQVRLAHEWLTDALGHHPLAFAYPNGNEAPAARAE